MKTNRTVMAHEIVFMVMDFMKGDSPYSKIDFVEVDGKPFVNCVFKTSAERWRIEPVFDPDPKPEPKPKTISELAGFQAPFIDMTGWSESKFAEKDKK